jgi:hypothetical protein
MLLAGITTAGAATIVQTQNFTNLGNGTQSHSWNGFNTAVGTLTSAVFVVNGTYSGSFSVEYPTTDTSVNSLEALTSLNLPGGVQMGSDWVALPLNGSFAPQGPTTTFTIQGSPGMTINSGNLVPVTALPSNYFTNTTLTSSLSRATNANLSEFSSTNDSNTRLNGTISLTYTYTPSAVEPVPEISTVTMGGAGGLLLLGIAARSRRRQQPSDSVPA